MKQNIRYLGFHGTPDGGRRFDFSVSTMGQHAAVSVDVVVPDPALADRILVQEYASICFAKVKKLFEDGEIAPTTVELVLTVNDILDYRVQQPAPEPHKVRADRVPY